MGFAGQIHKRVHRGHMRIFRQHAGTNYLTVPECQEKMAI